MENKQIVITEFGSAETLAVATSPVPEPKADEVLIKVAFLWCEPY